MNFVEAMRCMQLTIGIFVLTLIACGQAHKGAEVDPRAHQLAASAFELYSMQDTNSTLQAIQLLNRAIQIQPDYYYAHYNKWIFQNSIGRWDDGYRTLERLEELRPYNPYLKVNAGIHLELHGDSIGAREKFIEADKIYMVILDTLSKNADPSLLVLSSYALNLKLLGLENEGNALLDTVVEGQTEEYWKNLYSAFKMRNRKELLRLFRNKKEWEELTSGLLSGDELQPDN